mmetsp:Transcript_23210/g.46561  ORF Transcript_23210/g.46561 Transcript_23210/m.46561 type:complete len:210 (-) Transcript_23210:1865-2494(-)
MGLRELVEQGYRRDVLAMAHDLLSLPPYARRVAKLHDQFRRNSLHPSAAHDLMRLLNNNVRAFVYVPLEAAQELQSRESVARIQPRLLADSLTPQRALGFILGAHRHQGFEGRRDVGEGEVDLLADGLLPARARTIQQRSEQVRHGPSEELVRIVPHARLGPALEHMSLTLLRILWLGLFLFLLGSFVFLLLLFRFGLLGLEAFLLVLL